VLLDKLIKLLLLGALLLLLEHQLIVVLHDLLGRLPKYLDHLAHLVRLLLQVDFLLLLLLLFSQLLVLQSALADLHVPLQVVLLLLCFAVEVLRHAYHLLEHIVPVSHASGLRVLCLDFFADSGTEGGKLFLDDSLLLLEHG